MLKKNRQTVAEEKKKYSYLVQCWIKPKSGFDVARKNRIMTMFKEAMSSSFPKNEDLENHMKKFEEEHEGLILEPFVLETDKEVTDCKKELMPEIYKNHPGAKLFSWEIVPNLKSKE